jgi:hypothetical protein
MDEDTLMGNKFLEQIKEDLQSLRQTWIINDRKLESDWYAFNYWILNYLYHIDIEDIPDYITEYKDKGIDCFAYFEDAKELYIIQNCYYSDQSNLKREQMADFLTTPLISLINNAYTRSNSLQEIFNNLRNDPDFTVYLYCYTTKPFGNISKDILSLFDNNTYNYVFTVETKLIDINKLEELYKGNRFNNTIHFEYDIRISRKDLIEQSSEQHDKENNVDTAYVAVNVYDIYKMLEESHFHQYDLFDKNIREYLGIKGKRGKTNKDILNTLLDDVERNRFFYYNNGITMICDNFYKPQSNGKKSYLRVIQPQIVNGCQTVNTIFNAIEGFSEEREIKEVVNAYKHCSILLKIFKVNKTSETEKRIYENIVRYTNTQTSISAKDFVSKDDYFMNLQEDFLKRGFYLIVKQSDKHKFEIDNELFEKSKILSKDILYVFNKEANKSTDLFIELDKMLKSLMAFYFDGYTAYKCGSSALNEHSVKYYMNFSKKIRDYFSTDSMINLFLTYSDAGGTKIARTERYPIPYYMMDFIGRFIKLSNENKFDTDKVNNKLSYLFSSKEVYSEIFNKFCEIIEDYGENFKMNGIDYSTMTKNREIDSELLDMLIKSKKKEALRNDWEYFVKYMS